VGRSVWKTDPSSIDELRARVLDGFEQGGKLHGRWTLDGHRVQVFADKQNASRYRDAMVTQGAPKRSGVHCVLWDIAEVGAASSVSDPG
jgi:hypothetical protein